MYPEILPILLVLPFAGRVAALLFPANARNRVAWLAGAVAFAAHTLAWSAYTQVASGDVVRLSLSWLPALGLDFSLRLDGFAWVFTLLVTGIGLLVVMYARQVTSRRRFKGATG
jgi:multicomponent K+:H+ antiporter subunit A